MRYSPRHRILCALLALGLVLSAAPTSVTAAFVEERPAACTLSHGSPASDAAGPEAASALVASTGGLNTSGPACGSGPCSMPLTTCTAAGACLSTVPLSASASPALAPGLLGVPAPDARADHSSAVSAVLTPPPRS